VGGMKRSASGALADMAAAAARGAAAVPGGAGLSRSLAAVAAAVGLQGVDAAAEAELSIVGDYDGQKADVYSLGVLLVVLVLRRMPWNYDAVAERWVFCVGPGDVEGSLGRCPCGCRCTGTWGAAFLVRGLWCAVDVTCHALTPVAACCCCCCCCCCPLLFCYRLPLLKAMKALYDTAVVNRVSWRDATPKVRAAGLGRRSEGLILLLTVLCLPH
jgi:hypothetical protein